MTVQVMLRIWLGKFWRMRMGRMEYETWMCPKCGKRLKYCSREMRDMIPKLIGANETQLGIHFMHKLIENLELKQTDDEITD